MGYVKQADGSVRWEVEGLGDLAYVTHWPLAYRRAFVLTLPLSVPLWIAWQFLLFIALVFIGLFLSVRDGLWEPNDVETRMALPSPPSEKGEE
jgi:hypothetical protein